MSLDKKLTEMFTFFQDKDKNVVNVKEIPTIIRTLGNYIYRFMQAQLPWLSIIRIDTTAIP